MTFLYYEEYVFHLFIFNTLYEDSIYNSILVCCIELLPFVLVLYVQKLFVWINVLVNISKVIKHIMAKQRKKGMAPVFLKPINRWPSWELHCILAILSKYEPKVIAGHFSTIRRTSWTRSIYYSEEMSQDDHRGRCRAYVSRKWYKQPYK